MLSSFRPQGGIVSSVAIYASDFGRERMATEDVQGPAELIEESEGEDEETVEVMQIFIDFSLEPSAHLLFVAIFIKLT